MWALEDAKRIRHFWGGDGSKPISLCHLEGSFPLDYIRGAGVRKCQKCEKELGRKEVNGGSRVNATFDMGRLVFSGNQYNLIDGRLVCHQGLLEND